MVEAQMLEGAEPEVATTWVEASLNAPAWADWTAGPAQVADIVEQAVECAAAGAAIVHVQSCAGLGGDAEADARCLAGLIESVRARCDVIVYPGAVTASGPGLRLQTAELLARHGVLEWLAVDAGSANLCRYDALREDQPGTVLVNADAHLREVLRLCARLRITPSVGVLEPGFLRLAASLHWRCSSPAPVYRLGFSSELTAGFPPDDYGLTALLNLLDRVAPGSAWMVSGVGADVGGLLLRAVAEGGHLRVGLGDLPPGAATTSAALVAAAVDGAQRAGATIATAAQVRAQLHAREMGD